MFKKIDICGVKIDNINIFEVLQTIENHILKKSNSFIVTPNVDHIVKIQEDSMFKNVYKEASLVLADGMPILWAAKLLGKPLKEKISGSDLFPKLCEVAAEKGYKLFFLGGRPGSALKADEVLRNRYPDIQIVGTYSPPFGFENGKEENDKIIRIIKDAKPDILFVGLGAPKQEKWIYKYRNEYQVPVSIGVGVSFEFVSGMVKRAPLWMQRVGLEWFWRLMMEPKRLWKRYLIDDPVFFWLVLKQKLGLLK
jgi:N-acetylglucosaminyldiphosphoundecaprenol N-acetyl-beta-D-mannosaminyltransferase